MKKNSSLLGPALIILAAVFWGSMGLFVRPLSARGFSSLQIYLYNQGRTVSAPYYGPDLVKNVWTTQTTVPNSPSAFSTATI